MSQGSRKVDPQPRRLWRWQAELAELYLALMTPTDEIDAAGDAYHIIQQAVGACMIEVRFDENPVNAQYKITKLLYHGRRPKVKLSHPIGWLTEAQLTEFIETTQQNGWTLEEQDLQPHWRDNHDGITRMSVELTFRARNKMEIMSTKQSTERRQYCY